MDNIKLQILSRMMSGVIIFGKFISFLILISYQFLVEIVIFK